MTLGMLNYVLQAPEGRVENRLKAVLTLGMLNYVLQAPEGRVENRLKAILGVMEERRHH